MSIYFFLHLAFWAKPLTSHGLIYISLGYDLAPMVSLETMVERILNGVISIVSRFSPRDIFICGHSAGKQNTYI